MSEEEKKPVKSFAHLKELSSFLRDLLLTLVVAICLIHPASIKNFLNESGLSKLGAFGVTVELQEEKEKIADAQREVTKLVKATASVAPNKAPAEALNKPVDPDFKQVILTAERLAPQILPTAGWVFLGRVTEEKSRWAETDSVKTTASWPIKSGDIITVKDDVYVRAITKNKSHANSPVTTVSKIGDKLQIVEIEYSPAKIGGYYVWAKVALQTR